jgi:predicted nucleic acid-binding protein
MIPVFADSSYFLALLNADDELHPRVAEFTPTFNGRVITTSWVLTEVVDALSRPAFRQTVVGFMEDLRADPQVTVVPASQSPPA